MNRREAIAGMADITVTVAVAQTANAASQEANPDLDQIRALLQAHDQAFTNQDLDAVLACFTEKAAIMAPVRAKSGRGRTRLRSPISLQWLQVKGLLSDSDAWASAACRTSAVPLDVILSDPASEFSELYRLVDVCAVRDVRVSVPARPGLLKAVKLAASLRLPVRILPGQPTADLLAELTRALEFYLHEPMVEVPIEFFHSLLGSACGTDTSSLWRILEEDPAAFQHYNDDGKARLPRSSGHPSDEASLSAFVESHFERLLIQDEECATCPWQQVCRGYFKWPDPACPCRGVKHLFSKIDAAAQEIGRDLASTHAASPALEVTAYERPNLQCDSSSDVTMQCRLRLLLRA